MFALTTIFDKEFTFLNTYNHSFQWEITKLERESSSIIMEVSEKVTNSTTTNIKISVIRFDKVSKFQENEKSLVHLTRINKIIMSDVVHVVAKGLNFYVKRFRCQISYLRK